MKRLITILLASIIIILAGNTNCAFAATQAEEEAALKKLYEAFKSYSDGEYEPHKENHQSTTEFIIAIQLKNGGLE